MFKKLKFSLSILFFKTLIVSFFLMNSCQYQCFTDCEENFKEKEFYSNHKGGNKKKDSQSKFDPCDCDFDYDKYVKNENFNEFTDEVPTLCNPLELCLFSKRKYQVGKVTITHDENNDLYVTYNLDNDFYLKDVIIAIGTKDGNKFNVLPLNAYKEVDIYKLPYLKKFKEDVSTHTVKINTKKYLGDKYKECVVVFASALVESKKYCLNFLAYAGDCEIKNTKSDCGFSIRNGKVSRNDGGKFTEYCFADFDCDEPYSEDVDFTYAWEDLRDKGNDADYNDLVIQAVLNKVKDSLIFKFLPVARGAGYDHKFKFSIPKQGIVDVQGAASTKIDGDNMIITVFESTKAVLPPENQSPAGYSANVVYRGNNNDCLATKLQESTVTVKIDDTYEYDKDNPYQPFITVYTSGNTADDSKTFYDLFVWQVNNIDIWTHKDEKKYPNGILIQADWKWPKENQAIFSIYPDFPTTDNWSNGWQNNLAEPNKVIEKNFCD